MTLKALQQYFHEQLDDIYGQNEVSSFFRLLIDHTLNITPIELALHPNQTVSVSVQKQFSEAIKRLKSEEPIQYILGETEFFGLPLKVNKHTLIPRPETEELVQWILDELSNVKLKEPTILDIGTGSGCIAISLAKKLPNAKIHAMDISIEALRIAIENAQKNNVAVNFMEADILNFKSELENFKFDCIVSNPPYVRDMEKTQIKKNVLEHEPHLALFVKSEDPLQFYKAICEFSVYNLKPKGRLFFEINQYLGAETMQLLNIFNYKSIDLKQDIYGNDRMLKATKP